MARSRVALLWSLSLLGRRQTAATLMGPLVADDECASEGSADCAVVALQHKAGRLVKSALVGLEAHLRDAGTSGADLEAHASDLVALRQNWTHSQDLAPHIQAGTCSMNLYKGPPTGAEACFCQKAHNPNCMNKPCECREGCQGMIYQHASSMSFENRALTTCPLALLTIPRSYFSDIADLKRSCGGGAYSLLTSMLVDSYVTYATLAQSGTVWQCIHDVRHLSVHWLHLHTFCPEGTVDQLPSIKIAYCSKMTSIMEAGTVASKFLEWSR